MGMVTTLNTIEEFIQTNIADAVAIVENRDGITITPYLVLQKYTSLGQQFPAIEIHPSNVEQMEASAGNRSFFGNPTHRDEVISIRVFDRGNKTSTNITESNVAGYMDALEELFKSDYTLEGIKGVEILATEFTELFPDFSSANNELLLKGATLQLRVKHNIL